MERTRSPLGVQLSMINLFMWGDSHSHIHRHDGLTNIQDGDEVVEDKFSAGYLRTPLSAVHRM